MKNQGNIGVFTGVVVATVLLAGCTGDAPEKVARRSSALSAPGLVAAYAFDENTGSTAADATENGHVGNQHRRLGMHRLIEFFGRPRLYQCPQVVAQCAGSFRESVRHHAILRGQLGHHADGLRTLTRKHEHTRHQLTPCWQRQSV
jgi:hypothetical protein